MIHKRTTLLATILALALLAGCADEAPEPEPSPPSETPADEPVSMAPEGMPLVAEWQADCADGCGEQSLRFAEEQGMIAEELEIWLTWDGKEGRGVTFAVHGPDGTLHLSREGYHASRVIIADPMPGDYRVVVSANASYAGEYQGLAWADSIPEDGVYDLLPNISTLVPTDLSFLTPSVPNIEEGPDLPGLGGCLPQERLRESAQRCLRLSNGLGNNGAGRLHLTLEADEYVDALMGNARLVQHVTQSDGTVRQEVVGPAQLHDEHAHFHFAGLQHFTLYEFDPETGQQGEAAIASTKSGFCIEDRATMDSHPDPADAGVHSIVFCVLPDPTDDVRLHMGLEVGWYDLYFYELPQQYIETSGIPDGVYEVVSSNTGEGLLEEHLLDNLASTVIEIVGDQVTVLEKHGFYQRGSGESRV